MKFKRLFALLLLAMGLIVANAAEAVGAVGPQGPTGKKGPTGDKGLRGDKGATGNTGATGATGRTGAAGPKGGAKGDQGIPGTNGTNGGKGDQGDKGNTGLQGDKGDAGTQIADGTHKGDILEWDGASWTPVATEPVYILGDIRPDGGIVYYVDHSGQHGLEVKTEDEKFLMNYADAKIATESYNLGGNIGSCVSNCWHLPSKTELNLLFEAQSISSIGSLSCNFYLSSTKSSARSGTNQVWYQGFSYGEYLYGSQLSFLACVRAVRVF